MPPLAVVLPHRAPGTLGQVRAPLIPRVCVEQVVLRTTGRLRQPVLLSGLRFQVRGHDVPPGQLMHERAHQFLLRPRSVNGRRTGSATQEVTCSDRLRNRSHPRPHQRGRSGPYGHPCRRRRPAVDQEPDTRRPDGEHLPRHGRPIVTRRSDIGSWKANRRARSMTRVALSYSGSDARCAGPQAWAWARLCALAATGAESVSAQVFSPTGWRPMGISPISVSGRHRPPIVATPIAGLRSCDWSTARVLGSPDEHRCHADHDEKPGHADDHAQPEHR